MLIRDSGNSSNDCEEPDGKVDYVAADHQQDSIGKRLNHVISLRSMRYKLEPPEEIKEVFLDSSIQVEN